MQDYIIQDCYESPCGRLILCSYKDKLYLCVWENGKSLERHLTRIKKLLQTDIQAGSSAVMERAKKQLHEYFTRQRRSFSVPYKLTGTEFQKMVWSSLANISYGKTISYGEQARRLGMPSSVRAVANANGANPISIILPCHRVVGSDNRLTGYGGGLEAKQFLLDLEIGATHFRKKQDK